MKILFINDDLQGGGKQRRLVQLIRGLESNPQLELHLVIFDHKGSALRTGRKRVSDVRELVDFPEIWRYNVKIHFLERNSRLDCSLFIELYSLIVQIRPDVVNVWSIFSCFYLIPVYCVLWRNAPSCLVSSFVADCNGPKFPSIWWFLVRAAFWNSDRITGNSVAGLLAYQAPLDKSYPLYNGFDFTRFNGIPSRESVRSELRIPSGIAVMMSARFDPTKDYQTFIQAFLLLAVRYPQLSAVCVGQGPDFDKVKDLVPGEFKSRVIFTGYRTDVEAILSACDISVLCTNDTLHHEGVSNSLLEGMAAGHPVVATNSGGSPELVLDGETGFLVPSKDPVAVAHCIASLLDHPAKMREMGDAARYRIKEKFSLDRMTEEFARIFSEFGRS